MLRSTMLGWRTAQEERARELEIADHYDAHLMALDTTMEALEDRASALTPGEVASYFMGKLEGYTTFLETGVRPANWPEMTNLLGYDASHTVRATAETVRLLADPVSPALYANLSNENVVELASRHQAWLFRTCELLFSRQTVGLAIPLMNTYMREAGAAFLMDGLTDAMTSVRMVEDERSYRHLYAHAAQTLHEPLRRAFIERNEQLRAPLIPGAKRELQVAGDTTFAIDRFEENDPVTARLADGLPITLPYTHFGMRTLMGYDTPTEHEMRETQSAVDYTELDDAAKLAVEEAWRAADLHRTREETLPYYKRLVLKPAELEGGKLHTQLFRDGYHRRLDFYPDDHGFVTSNTEQQVGPEVASAEPVLDTYLVVPYRDDYAQWTTYLDVEPNFFGPGEDRANAFWVSGEPRIVVDRTGSPKYMRSSDYTGRNDTARWVIMPVRYYWVTERRSVHANDADSRFF